MMSQWVYDVVTSAHVANKAELALSNFNCIMCINLQTVVSCVQLLNHDPYIVMVWHKYTNNVKTVETTQNSQYRLNK